MANSRSPRAKAHPTPKKFNRAVSTFRTPKKATNQLLEDDFDLLDFCDSSDVDLINDILQSSDFNMELDSFREEREKELKIVRSWFNANKKFNGLGEDDIIKLLEDSDDDVVKIEADSSEDEDPAIVDQLDGTAEDQKRDEGDKKPNIPPPGQIVTKPKEEDVEFEALSIPPTGPILLHSTLGHSQASPGSTRGQRTGSRVPKERLQHHGTTDKGGS